MVGLWVRSHEHITNWPVKCLLQQSYKIFLATSHYRRDSAIYFSITLTLPQYIVSQFKVGICSMEYAYKLLQQFAMTIGGTKCYLWLKQSKSNLLQGDTKCSCSYFQVVVAGRLLDTHKMGTQ